MHEAPKPSSFQSTPYCHPACSPCSPCATASVICRPSLLEPQSAMALATPIPHLSSVLALGQPCKIKHTGMTQQAPTCLACSPCSPCATASATCRPWPYQRMLC